VIEVRDLWKSFGDNEVLKGISLSIPQGTTYVVLGGSGSGKTVLMKHVIGLLKPDRGSVVVNGLEITRLDGKALTDARQVFGMVFQGAALFDSMTVYENVSFALREHTQLSEDQIRAKVREKLGIVGLQNVEERYPAELSGGMRKRVGLARAIVLDPKIVLYDEPTTGLDPITTDYVDDMILTAKRELHVTQVVISHDIASSFKVADKVAFLFKGKIVAEGPPRELRNTPHPELQHFLQMWFGKS
jgi:phospholipid/cholesterol/gamma-HCH transport system ATP-binding protein